jgi:O-antigen ligase
MAPNSTARFLLAGLSGVLAILSVFTQSRSALVAVVGALVIVSPLVLLRLAERRPHAVLPLAFGSGSLVMIGTLIAAAVLGDRLIGFVAFDPTVQVRLDALTALWQVAGDHLVVGVGYNALQFFVQEEGFLADTTLHSRAGADNSFLTLLITTGIPGVLLFLLPWAVAATRAARRWLEQGHWPSLVALVSLLALTLHSQFINSWLYAHLLIVMAVILALATTPYDRRV